MERFDARDPDALTDRFRGLIVSPVQVRKLLQPTSRPTRSSALWPATRGSLAETLTRRFGLDAQDLEVLLVAAAPELDLRYEQVYGYLQDDVTRRRPTVSLVIQLLAEAGADGWAWRRRMGPAGALRSSGAVELLADPQQAYPPELAHYVRVDEHVLRLLLADPGVDSRLHRCARLMHGTAGLADLAIGDALRRRLLAATQQSAATPPRMWLHGAAGAGKRTAALALAHDFDRPALVLDAAQIDSADAIVTLRRAAREARRLGAVLVIAGADARPEGTVDAALVQTRARVAPEDDVPWIVTARADPEPTLRRHFDVVAMPLPDGPLRARLWREALAGEGQRLATGDIDSLAQRFRLTPQHIQAAACEASRMRAPAGSAGKAPGAGAVLLGNCERAARAQSGRALASVAERIESAATWDDLVLPADALAQLHELCQRVVHQEQVIQRWGFARKLTRGRGTAALFSGGSGTGKTMAAEVIANAVGLELYRIDLARVVSKYIGETEKNLDRVFTAAENANAILFFDEADALFGKRSEVKDAHDRYANIETAYLLQKMEGHAGVTILATNLPAHLDAAFMRRLALQVHFPFPDEAARHAIWRQIWPAEVPLAADAQPARLAAEFKLTGGEICNAALAAAFAAASDGDVIQLAHVRAAVRRELVKAGRHAAGAAPLPQPLRASLGDSA